MTDDPKQKDAEPGAAPAPTDAPEGPPPTSAPAGSPGAGLTQEDIARRVEALTKEESDVERLAAAEERKLAERRERSGANKKRSGLEEAAAKKLAKIGAEPKEARSLSRAPFATAPRDAGLEKAESLAKWAKDNAAALRIGALAAVVLAAGGIGYATWRQKTQAAASALFQRAVSEQRGRIADPAKDKEREGDRYKDPSPVFSSAEQRRETALASYREVVAKYKGTGAAYLARLSEGSLLLDKGDATGALTAFADVKASPLAAADTTVRARALEGMGFALELDAATKSKDEAKTPLEKAAGVYKELADLDKQGFRELGLYHQARVAEQLGDMDKAKDLLKSARERIQKSSEKKNLTYVEQAVDDRLRALDPSAVPPKPKNPFGGAGGLGGMSMEQIKALLQQQQGGGE